MAVSNQTISSDKVPFPPSADSHFTYQRYVWDHPTKMARNHLFFDRNKIGCTRPTIPHNSSLSLGIFYLLSRVSFHGELNIELYKNNNNNYPKTKKQNKKQRKTTTKQTNKQKQKTKAKPPTQKQQHQNWLCEICSLSKLLI